MAGDEVSPSKTLQNTRNESIIVYRMATKRVQNPPRQSTLRSSQSKDFRLENYRLEQKMEQLEKEKKHCIHRHKEEKHVFKMSMRIAKEASPEYWEKYGENFRANGEYRDTGASPRIPSAMPKQTALKTKKDHQSIENLKSSKRKPVACKTVADLIALMRDTTPLLVDHEATTTIDSRRLCTTPEDTATIVTNKIKRNHDNDNLRLLLENYEVFVPKEDGRQDLASFEDRSASAQVRTSQQVQTKKAAIKSCYDDLEDYQKSHSLVRSKSVQPSDGRCREPSTSYSDTKFHKHIKKRLSDESTTSIRRESLRPTVRQIGTLYDNESRMPREFFWNSPSRRIVKMDETRSYTPSLIDRYNITGLTSTYFQGTPESTELNDIHSNWSELASTNDSRAHSEDLFSYRGQSVTPSADSSDEVKGIKKWEVNENREGLTEDIPEITRSPSKTYRLRQLLQQKGLRSPRQSEQPCKPPTISIKTLQPYFPIEYKKRLPQNYKRVMAFSRAKSRLVTSPKTNDPMIDGDTKTADRPDSHHESDYNAESRASQYCLTVQEPKMMVLGKGLRKDQKDQKAKQTRQKMDQFFARLDSTRLDCTKIQSSATRPSTASLISKERKFIKEQKIRG